MRQIYQKVFTTALATSIGCLLIKKIMTMLIRSNTLFAILELDIIKNKGFFMGLWGDNPMLIKTVMGFCFILFCFMLYKTAMAYPKVSTIYILAPWMMFAGLTGNMIEMLLNGSVTDYIAIRQPWVETFYFNIEDCLIQTGAILFTYQSIFHNSTIEKIYKG